MKNSFASRIQLDKLLVTSSIDELSNFIQALEKRAFPQLGLITSPAGYGKTMAIAYLAENVFNLSGTGFQHGTLLVKIPTRSTNLAVAQTIAGILNEELPNSRESANRLSEKICEKLIAYGIERVFFDEANRLNEQTFDFVRVLHDTLICEDAQIAFFLIGLPAVLRVIKKHEQFASRTIHHSFSPLKQQEVLEYFLPNLKIDGWNFDPKEKLHMELGAILWESVKPSLRRLVGGIETACQLNIKNGNTFGFSDLVEAAIEAADSLEIEDDSPEEEDSAVVGSPEEKSQNIAMNRQR